MATEVYTTEEIVLLDGSEVEIRPLPIAKLRKFSRIWSEHISEMSKKFVEREDEDSDLTDADLTDAQFDAFIKMCALGLEQELKGTMTDKQFREHLENVLDESTIYKILKVTGNLSFGEDDTPNQVAPANQAGAGTN